MNIEDQIEREFSRLVAGGCFDGGLEMLTADTESGRLECEVVAVDSIACAFRRLSLATDQLAGATIDDLKKIAQTLASQLIYLLEPISPVEVDGAQVTVQLRSNPPHKDDEGTSYYELLVRGDGLSLCRYTKSNGQIRSIVPARVTREVFVRLADDFVAAIVPPIP